MLFNTDEFFCFSLLFQEKYDDENENSSEKINNNNNETTIVATGGNTSQPQQIFHVQVEYEEPKPKMKLEEARKRRLVKKESIEISQQQLLNQYVNQMQPISLTPKQNMPTIVIDDKSQDHHDIRAGSDVEEPPSKVPRLEEAKKMDKFDIFGMFVASEMRNLRNPSSQRKLKRKLLECVMEMNDQDSDQQ